MDLLYKNSEENKIDIAIIAEPNKEHTKRAGWFTDKNRDVGIRIFNKSLKAYKWERNTI